MQISLLNTNRVANEDISGDDKSTDSSDLEVQSSGFESIFTGMFLLPDNNLEADVAQPPPQIPLALTGEITQEELLLALETLAEQQRERSGTSTATSPVSETEVKPNASPPDFIEGLLPKPKTGVEVELSTETTQTAAEEDSVEKGPAIVTREGTWPATKVLSSLIIPEDMQATTTPEAKSFEVTPSSIPITATSVVHTSSEVRSAQNAEIREVEQVIERPSLQNIGKSTIRTVRYMVSSGEKIMSIKLVPASLGHIQIEVHSAGDEMTVRLLSANPAVRQALQGQLGQLQEAFARDGLQLSKVEVSTGLAAFTDPGGHPSQETDRHQAPKNRRIPWMDPELSVNGVSRDSESTPDSLKGNLNILI
jgi:flagellar hook-length control protein FliK